MLAAARLPGNSITDRLLAATGQLGRDFATDRSLAVTGQFYKMVPIKKPHRFQWGFDCSL
ncbi:MAG: hypothetical protein ONB16_12670 [candidate division KSB1 bacterium]|nr:hypothetical protein [candidate division KSB1 bacterium]MDZ7319077.1 hypothetical protein [candidate division KSB1 bacterium]MDZ7340867.1 hypothetical protein [candidate division KSB1 bacterium]